MKRKALTLVLALSMTAVLAACGNSSTTTTTTTTTTDTTAATDAESEAAETEAAETEAAETEAATEAVMETEVVTEAAETEAATEEIAVDSTEETGAVMTYEEYCAAELDTEVTIEAYVQAHQSWWEDQITVYAQDEEGGYFIYNMACSEEDAALLVPGTKIKVTGYKSEWSGEIEIADATFEFDGDDTYIAEPVDVTEFLGTDDLQNYQNQLVSFKGMTVEAADDSGAAFLYNWDGSGSEGDDLYFNVSLNGETYTFTVESYLCDKDSDVYKAVEGLTVGQTVDLIGFLYWYEGAQPHVTSVTVE